MSEVIVSKAGGTSNADAAAVEQSLGWAEESDIFVVSAPGKLTGSETVHDKVTNTLLGAYSSYAATGEIPSHYTDAITERYSQIVDGLGESTLPGAWVDNIPKRVLRAVGTGKDASSMLGEQLQAEVYESLGFKLIDPVKSPHLLGSDPEAWRGWLSEATRRTERYVLPGNTTVANNRLETFSRGGSDTSGGLAAYAIDADLHLNLTDHGALSASPQYIPRASLSHIDHLLYEEGRELGRNGTGLLHPAAMVPLMKGHIPTEIRSTFDRNAPFTRLDNDTERAGRRAGWVAAISLMENVRIHRIHEPGMAEAVGRLAAFEGGLAENDIALIDAQGDGVDAQKYFVHAEDADASHETLQKLTSGSVETGEKMSLITMVGYRLDMKLMNNIVRLVMSSGMDPKEWQLQGNDFSVGRHSLRVSSRPEDAQELLVNLHESFVGSRNITYAFGGGMAFMSEALRRP